MMFFLRNRLPERYDRTVHIGPGHPLYERIRREVEEERRRIANDPETIRRIRASIDRKVASVRQQAEWKAERAWTDRDERSD